jgi:CHAT domain-containing protein/tetratricopeptide (TPR) repeat protein
LASHSANAQAPAASPAPKRQEQVQEREKLTQQIDELRQAGKFDEAVALAERALEMERRASSEASAPLAEALSRLAELHELRGDWARALARRQEALAVRERVDGMDHWRTADARLAVAFAEKVGGLAAADRARVQTALRKEQETAQLQAQGKNAEAERLGLEVLEAYRSVVGPGTAEAARVWHAIGRARMGRSDLLGGKEANERAVAIRRLALPKDHPDLGRSLNNLALADVKLGNFSQARRALEEAVKVWQTSLGTDDPLTAQGLTTLANLQRESNDPLAAEKSYKALVAIRRKDRPADHPDIAEMLYELGGEQRKLRDYAAAFRSFQEALSICRRSLGADDIHIANCLKGLGLVQESSHDYRAAKSSYEEALAICRKTLPADHPIIAESLNDLGIGEYHLRDLPAAKKNFEAALALRTKSLGTDHPDTLQTLYNLGLVQQDLAELAGARNCYERVLAIRRKTLPENHPLIANSLLSLGNVQRDQGEYPAARKSFEESLAIRRKALPQGHLDIAWILMNFGNVQAELREYAAARASFEEALSIRRRGMPQGHVNIAETLLHLGQTQRDLREYKAAMACYEEALIIFRKSLPQDFRAIATSLTGLAGLQFDLRDYPGAKASLEAALAIRRKILPEGSELIGESLLNLAGVLYYLEDYKAARRSYDDALLIFRKKLPAINRRVADCLEQLGSVQGSLGDLAGAKTSLQQALDIRRKLLPEKHPAIALNLYKLGGVQVGPGDNALKSYVEAYNIQREVLPKDHPDRLLTIDALAILSHSNGNDPMAAIALVCESIDIKRQLLVRLALAQAEPEQLRSAVMLRSSLDLLLSVAEGASPELTELIYARVLAVKGSVTARQRWSRRARDDKDPVASRLLVRLQQANRELLASAANPMTGRGRRTPESGEELQELSNKRARLEQELAARCPAFHGFLIEGLRGVDIVRTSLPPSTALVDCVEYLHRERDDAHVPLKRRMVAFVVRPDQKIVTRVPLGPSEVLRELIDRWRLSYGAGKSPPAGEPDPGPRLRTLLWEPLEPHLDGTKSVLISPDGALNSLPWTALPGSKPGTFLIHDRAFAIIPVTQLLPEVVQGAPRSAKDRPSLLLVGGIDFGERSAQGAKAPESKLPKVTFFKPLPGAESEVNDVDARFRRTFPETPQPQVLSEREATKLAVLTAAPTHRFVHLATHGFFADESEESAINVAQRAELLRDGFYFRPEAAGRHPGLLSGLVFAGVNLPDKPPEDTILTALEAAELNLDKVELVTLSACDTGRGRVAGGEGVLGLQRAFQLAGARSVLASLWKVPDEETHQLMREFYRRVWSKDPISKAEALRQAQLWMLENWKPRGTLGRPEPKGPPSPYYWAAFVLSGDWR